ncbi:sensor histidine kinase, partial [Methylibium sp.]|uniref:sensor histidine kinase n=1 Tax=Methylibium sp. TaxID=2067992 RepID=UPI0017CD6435
WALALGNLVHVAGDEVRVDLNAQTEESLRTSSTVAMFFVVLGPDGEPIAGDALLREPRLALVRGERRLFETRLDGLPVRVAVHAVECGRRLCQVRVAETLDERERARTDSLVLTLLLAFGSTALFALAIGFVVNRAMRPLTSVNQQLALRSLDDLRPLRRGRMPAEVQPLLDAVDQLLARVAADATRQRHFIADAAHQLRTPLTALRTETELALLEAHPGAVHATLERLHRSAQRAARLADQLLALARSEASSREPGGAEPVDLKAVAHDAAQDWVPRALERGADLGFQLESAPLRGRHHLLGELLGNLIHNALEYACANPARPARITVRTGLLDAGAGVRQPVLEVEDNGPGIAPAERERVFERFYRPAGSMGAGSGLGLAIVRDIAQLHGASVFLLDGEDGGGLVVRVVFPAGR